MNKIAEESEALKRVKSANTTTLKEMEKEMASLREKLEWYTANQEMIDKNDALVRTLQLLVL